MDRLLGLVSRVLAGFACLAAFLLTIFVLLSAVMRYFLGQPFFFTEDVVSLLFLATSFLSIPITAHQRSYIRINLVTQMLPPYGQRLARIFGALVFLIFVLWFAWDAYEITSFSYQIGAQSETAEIPVAPWMALMPLSMSIVALLCIVQIAELIRALISGSSTLNGGEAGLQ